MTYEEILTTGIEFYSYAIFTGLVFGTTIAILIIVIDSFKYND
jgi:hypothetical protein